MITADEVASHLVHLVETSLDQKITGVQLSAVVRHKFPDFSPASYGCANLRDFIRKFGISIEEVGRSGADIVYGLRHSLTAAPKTVGVEGGGDQRPIVPHASINLRSDIYID